MDPQETWSAMLSAWSKRDWHCAQELAESLLGWLRKGGFPPEVVYPRQLGADLDRVIAVAAAQLILRRTTAVLDDANRIPADVPFSLTCARCLDQGPMSFEEAIQLGWTGIEYVPESSSENFLGICADCNRSR